MRSWSGLIDRSAAATIYQVGLDFQAGDVGYVDKSLLHYIENTGDTDLVFLEVFRTPFYEDISLAEWVAHTPARLVNEHIATGEDFLSKLPRKEMVITPE